MQNKSTRWPRQWRDDRRFATMNFCRYLGDLFLPRSDPACAAIGPRFDVREHGGKRFWFDLDSPGERSIDGDNDQQFRKNQQCKQRRHHDLRPLAFRPKEKREADRDHGSAQQDQPNDIRHGALRGDQPGATGLCNEFELSKHF